MEKISRKRVIPGLLLAGERIVKGMGFASYEYVGDPINVIRIFNEKEVEEILVVDIFASKNGIIQYGLIADIAEECFMPLTYGGGVNDLAACDKIFSIGVEKISLNHSQLHDQSLLSIAAKRYGSQSISVAIDYVSREGKAYVYDHVSGKQTGISLFEQLKRYEDAGAGEVLLTSQDREGGLKGLELESIAKLNEQLTIPVLVGGGANSVRNVKSAFELGFSGVVVGSYFIYHGPYRAVLIDVPDELKYEALN